MDPSTSFWAQHDTTLSRLCALQSSFKSNCPLGAVTQREVLKVLVQCRELGIAVQPYQKHN